MALGDRIRDARKEKGLTQRQLADMVNAKHNSISNWENNQNKPDPDTIELLCGVLGVSPSWLLSGSEYIESENKFRFDTRIDDTPYNRALKKLQNKETLTEEETVALKEELPKVIDSTLKAFKKFSDTIEDLSKKRLITYYEALNSEGKVKLLERAEELTYIPKYQKQEEEVLEAAHERTDIKVTDEMIKHDDELMRNNDIWNK